MALAIENSAFPTPAVVPPANTSKYLALEHVDVVAEVGGLDLDLGEIDRPGRRGRGRGLLLRECATGQQEGYGKRSTSNPSHRKFSPKPLPMFKTPYPCFSSTGCQRLPSCGLRTSLLECGQRTKRRCLQDAVTALANEETS